MPSPLSYPQINGARQSFVSTNVVFQQPAIGNLAGGQALSQALRGYTSIDYGRKRTREMMYGNHPDPVAKTRGVNAYKCGAKYYLAEVNLIRAALQALYGGLSGYGEVFFNLQITHFENGMDSIIDTIEGCTLDDDQLETKQGPTGTLITLDFGPLKILMNGVDDCDPILQ